MKNYTLVQGLEIYASRARCGSFDDVIWLADKITLTFLRVHFHVKIFLNKNRVLVLKVGNFFQNFVYIQ